MEIVPIDKKRVNLLLAREGVIGIVGIYGSGKSLCVNWITQTKIGTGDRVIRVSFKDLPTPTNGDIPLIAGQASWAALHASWRRQAIARLKRKRYLWIVIEEAQVIDEVGDTLWEVVKSLLYYQREAVRLVLTGQPRILETKQLCLAQILRGRLVNPRRLTMREMREYAGSKSSDSSLRQVVAGHWGTLKYVVRACRGGERSYSGGKRKLINTARAGGEMYYFAREMWNGLSIRQRQVVVQYVQTGRVDLDEKAVRELIQTGLLRRHGQKVFWFVDWTKEFVREYLHSLPRGVVEVNESVFGVKERAVYMILKEAGGRVVRYDELITSVWGEESEATLWTISRLVGRLRAKLTTQGLGGVIGTKRGIGFYYAGTRELSQIYF